MDQHQRKLLDIEVTMLQSSISHLQLVLQMQPYDARTVEATLKSIESQCAFMRQYTVTPHEPQRLRGEVAS